MRNNAYSKYCYLFFSELDSETRPSFREAIYRFLWSLNLEYGGFCFWFKRLFGENDVLIPGREIIFAIENRRIVGVSILKKSPEENKICTLRVDTAFQRQGIGKQLLIKSFDWLEDEKPLITVHHSKERQFEKLFRYFGFQKEGFYKRYYTPFSAEIAYNGILPSKGLLERWLSLPDMRPFLDEYVKKGGKILSAHELIDLFIRYLDEGNRAIRSVRI